MADGGVRGAEHNVVECSMVGSSLTESFKIIRAQWWQEVQRLMASGFGAEVKRCEGAHSCKNIKDSSIWEL